MFCKNCGKEINNNASVCIYCGVSTEEKKVVDNGGIGWGALGCCIPIVGLILFLVWKDTKPNSAKAAGMGALISVVLSFIFYLLMFFVGIGSGL